jgi:hypothetical protein
MISVPSRGADKDVVCQSQGAVITVCDLRSAFSMALVREMERKNITQFLPMVWREWQVGYTSQGRVRVVLAFELFGGDKT